MSEFEKFLDNEIKFTDSKRDCALKAWNDRQAVIDEIEAIVRKERGHISYCETPRAKEMFKAILKAIGKPDPKETNSSIDEWANPLG